MDWTCLNYEGSLRELWEELALVCKNQEQGDFPIPEAEEGETGILFLCKEGETMFGALSAVTFDCSQYFFYPWCLPKWRQEVGTVLCQKLEDWLLENHSLPLQLSCYVNGLAEDTIQMLKEQGYECTDEEFMMEFEFSQYPLKTSALTSNCSIQYRPCSDKKTLSKLYQDIFSTGKKEAAVYIDSITAESSVQFYTLSGSAPCDFGSREFKENKKNWSQKKILGMFGLIPHGSTVYLFSFGILPKYRRQGFGVAALQKICTTLREQYTKIAVHVSGSNMPAMELYRAFGFCVKKHIALYEKELL